MTTPLQATAARLRVPVSESDHVRGPADAPVTIVQYGDYQCPYCGAAHRELRELFRQRAEVVRLVYRHFPIDNMHPYAEHAAETAEAAGARGEFWAVHDWLFEHQDQLDPVHLSIALEQLGLVAEDLDRETDQHAYADRVRRDFVGGIRSGVEATPTFFVNGVRHDGPYTLPDLLTAVDEAAGE